MLLEFFRFGLFIFNKRKSVSKTVRLIYIKSAPIKVTENKFELSNPQPIDG